jgi:hypothetical protein
MNRLAVSSGIILAVDSVGYRTRREDGQFKLVVLCIHEQVSLLPMEQAMRLSTALALTGTSLEAHLTEVRRDVFTKAGATPISELPHLKHGQRVQIGGPIVARQHPPTAKGFAFLAVEDSGNVESRCKLTSVLQVNQPYP